MPCRPLAPLSPVGGSVGPLDQALPLGIAVRPHVLGGLVLPLPPVGVEGACDLSTLLMTWRCRGLHAVRRLEIKMFSWLFSGYRFSQ